MIILTAIPTKNSTLLAVYTGWPTSATAVVFGYYSYQVYRYYSNQQSLHNGEHPMTRMKQFLNLCDSFGDLPRKLREIIALLCARLSLPLTVGRRKILDSLFYSSWQATLEK